MTIYSNVVIHNPVSKKHVPVVPGDQLAGSLLQLSTDAGNSVVLGTDGGLKVSIPAQLPDDQVLTGDNTGSVSVTLTPTVVGDQTNYLIKADTKVDPAAGNIATVSSAGVYVPTPVIPTPTVGTAPTIVDDGTTTTQYFGGNTVALGDPLKWVSTDGGVTVTPVYTASGISGSTPVVSTPVVSASKQTAFGSQAVTTTASFQTHTVTFATAFPTIPFITLSSAIEEDVLIWKARNVTTTGFTLEGYGNGSNSYTGNVNWKAEEK